MFLPGPYGELGFVAALLLGLAIPSAMLFHYRKPWPLWPSLGWLGLLFFLQIKEAFVRYDSFHVWMGIVNALLPCCLLLICLAGFFDPAKSYPPIVRVLTRVCVVGGCRSPCRYAFMGIENQNAGGIRTISGTGSKYGCGQSSRLRSKLLCRLSAPLGRVQAYAAPARSCRHGGHLSRRPGDALWERYARARLPPIPQSFEAYHPYLSKQNASFFRGPNRPDFVFFDIAPIDTRYPSAADPFSWLALMDCYLPAGKSGRYLVLRAAGCEGRSSTGIKSAA